MCLRLKVIFYGEAVDQVSQRGCGCPIPGNIQGQVEQGSEQPDLVKNVPALCRGWSTWPLKAPSNPNYSMILFCYSKSWGRSVPVPSHTGACQVLLISACVGRKVHTWAKAFSPLTVTSIWGWRCCTKILYIHRFFERICLPLQKCAVLLLLRVFIVKTVEWVNWISQDILETNLQTSRHVWYAYFTVKWKTNPSYWG